LQLTPIERRDLRDDDLAVRVDYCGVCHSHLHALHGIGPGSKVAMGGLGGLGHLGVKLAVALGAEVKSVFGRFGLILDTIAAVHDFSPLLRLLTLGGTLSVLGAPIEASVRIMELTFGRKNLSSSGTGGTRHTAELLTFCAERGITADIELLPSTRVDEASRVWKKATSVTAS
jgi:uncharacterized zinc-type alcohol dehydrogenase-like protein